MTQDDLKELLALLKKESDELVEQAKPFLVPQSSTPTNNE